ncbi:ABC transporter ATP-binding protein [Nocardioides sp. GXZ039]|uniref:ABC transporter ATP-binding protein n=1 Tax=Nocardioides sp. GXZ039 TaxID=3136018 RepID=UPI0030F39F66
MTSLSKTEPDPPGRDARVVLSARGVRKAFGSRVILEDITLDVPHGEFICIVGPSGAGKTTLLRCMAGLLKPTAGTVTVDGAQIDGPPEPMAVVLQDYSRSLLPWMTVRANVLLPLRRRRLSRSEKHQRIDEALAAVGLPAAADQYPWQLSGGMQQRVSIARALAYRPEILLMDEPFASVDAQTRADLEDLMLELRARYDMTIALVTHDIDEAVYLADRVVVLSGSPTRVTKSIPVPLGATRDQVETKARTEFVELRGHVMTLIRSASRSTRV